jgi:hypothetical protein
MRHGDTLSDGREPDEVGVGVGVGVGVEINTVSRAYAETATRATRANFLANIIVEIRESGEKVGEAVRLGERHQEEGMP